MLKPFPPYPVVPTLSVMLLTHRASLAPFFSLPASLSAPHLAAWFGSSLLVGPGGQLGVDPQGPGLGAAPWGAGLATGGGSGHGPEEGQGLALGPAAPHALADGQLGQRAGQPEGGLGGAAAGLGGGERRQRLGLGGRHLERSTGYSRGLA